MEFSKRTKTVLLIIAGVLLLAALCLHFLPSNKTSYAWVTEKLSSHGLSVDSASLIYEGNASNTSIRTLLIADKEAIQKAVNASLKSGFPSNIDLVGNVVQMSVSVNQDEKLNIYIFENEETPMQIELCFIQNIITGEVRGIK